MSDDYWRSAYDADLGNFHGWRTFGIGSELSNYSDISNRDILSFGVFAGKTTIEMFQLLNSQGLKPNKYWCFDSFQGIPLEEAEPVQDLWHPEKSHFFKAFNASEFFEEEDVENAVIKFLDRIEPYNPGIDINIISGFLEETLTDELAQEITKPLLVIIDVDTYSSTKPICDWLIRNDLMIPGDTFIGYDDWGGTPGFQDMLDGESRAHKEMLDQGLKFEYRNGVESQVYKYLGRD